MQDELESGKEENVMEDKRSGCAMKVESHTHESESEITVEGRQVIDDNLGGMRAMQANLEGMGDNQGGVQDGQEGGGTDRGAEGPGHRVGADKGKYSYSSAHGDILFCAKTRKLRNVRRDKLKQLSLKNFTVQTLRKRKWAGFKFILGTK